jgi:hypothetical protein
MDTGFDSLTPLAADQRFEWSRGRSLHSGRPVLLKRLRTSTPSSAEVAALRRESALAADLPSLAALLPRWSDGPAMLFEDPGGLLASQATPPRRRPADDRRRARPRPAHRHRLG